MTFTAPSAWKLAAREAQLLNLMLAARETATKQSLHTALYADDPDGGPDLKIIDVFACKLRKKLAPLFAPDTLVIETVWGRGYRIDDLMKAAIRAHDASAHREAS